MRGGKELAKEDFKKGEEGGQESKEGREVEEGQKNGEGDENEGSVKENAESGG